MIFPTAGGCVRAVHPTWFGRCIGVIYTGAPLTDEASTTGETAGRSAEVTSAATVFGSESEASESFRAAAKTMEGSQSAGASCVADSLGSIGRSGDLRDVHELSVVASVNVDEAKGWRIGLHLDEVKPLHDTLMDSESPAYLDWLVIRQGMTIVELFTYDMPSPFDPDLRDQLIEKLAGRLAGNASE